MFPFKGSFFRFKNSDIVNHQCTCLKAHVINLLGKTCTRIIYILKIIIHMITTVNFLVQANYIPMALYLQMSR